jgi:hypothetical protein
MWYILLTIIIIINDYVVNSTNNKFFNKSFQEGGKMEKKKVLSKKKEINPSDVTICDATAQMLEKAKRDGVETAFDRAAGMRACPIGVDSACCKHCSMGPCRLSAKDPYGKVGVCDH